MNIFNADTMNIAVLFGSRSVEHDVSITSAFGVMKGLEKIGTHQIFPIYVTRSGKWIYDPKFCEIQNFTTFSEESYTNISLHIDTSKIGKLAITQKKCGLFGKKIQFEVDFVFPIFHGLNGEDGSVQGLLDMLQVPYHGPSILASALGMNKIMMKQVFRDMGLPLTAYKVFHQKNYDEAKVFETLSLPLIVKPANLGSSIGISKVEQKEDLKNAVEIAFHYDEHIIIESCVQNLVELNCSVALIDGKIQTSLVEQPIGTSEFLSFEEKYVSQEGGTMQGAKNRVKIPAEISDTLTQKIKDFSIQIFETFFAKSGAPRIDYLYDSKNDLLYVNEINTIPGALQMHLWDASGFPPKLLLEKMIESGINAQNERKINIDFDSNIIGHTIAFTK